MRGIATPTNHRTDAVAPPCSHSRGAAAVRRRHAVATAPVASTGAGTSAARAHAKRRAAAAAASRDEHSVGGGDRLHRAGEVGVVRAHLRRKELLLLLHGRDLRLVLHPAAQ